MFTDLSAKSIIVIILAFLFLPAAVVSAQEKSVEVECVFFSVFGQKSASVYEYCFGVFKTNLGQTWDNNESKQVKTGGIRCSSNRLQPA